MGRAGVTLLDVEKAALQLQGRGKNPSVDAVREILGTGSKSTIAQHLRDWRAKQSEADGKLPQELFSLVAGLWERLNLQADQRISEIESDTAQQIQALKQTYTKLQQDYTNLQEELHRSQETCVVERTTRENLEKELLFSQQEHAKLIERHQVITQQLEDYKKENDRLHKLANNIQANLEHYQNAIQQLRTEQNLAIEKQQTQFQQELSSRHQQLHEYEKQLNQKTLEIQQFQNQYQSLQETHNALTQRNQEINHEFVILQDRYRQQEKIMATQEQSLITKDKQIIEMEKQIAILTEQKIHLQKSFGQMEDKIEALRHEKMFLIQEKSELQGHLKQLERGNKCIT